MIRVLLVDDQATTRRGLRMQLELEPDLEVVGEADDGAAALDQVLALNPDVVLMDVQMPRMDGITTLMALRRVAPAVPVVVHSLDATPGIQARAKAAGAAAFVEKQPASGPLVAALRDAVGETGSRGGGN